MLLLQRILPSLVLCNTTLAIYYHLHLYGKDGSFTFGTGLSNCVPLSMLGGLILGTLAKGG